jgi:hypothetical protein
MKDGHTSSPLKLPLRHWACLLVLGCVLTGVLFTRCCGHLVGPVAPLLMVPFILGSFVSIATLRQLEAVGFAIGLTLELALIWWLLRAALLAAWIKR